MVDAEHDPRPPYVRTADRLREEIRSGVLKPGDRLPSARELQDRFDIANSTAQNAVRVLKREGLVYAVKGKGVFVRRAARQDEPLLGTRELSGSPFLLGVRRRPMKSSPRPWLPPSSAWPAPPTPTTRPGPSLGPSPARHCAAACLCRPQPAARTTPPGALGTSRPMPRPDPSAADSPFLPQRGAGR
ncbi:MULTISPECIES: GntR family transcriptional regulator [unclassified Streptomyces]|uniref:GntR family transcriptional regulator n=1 Tax=unclassified Streptomyces TaxID=2593676 RepID=UPI003390081B